MLRQIILFASLALLLAWPARAEIAPESLPALEAGDLLFKGAETGAGTRLAASWSLGDKRWGHIGIVVADEDGQISVIHADTGAPGEVGAVRRVPLATFLSDVSSVGIYEVRLTGTQRATYLAFADKAVGLPFDHGFSIQTENNLYCSELVWRALSAGLGHDAVPEKSRRLGRVYVSVSDIAELPLLHETGTVSAGRPPPRVD